MQLDINSLSHQYRNGKRVEVAIKPMSLTITPGILGLLGPNGAGKSSLMRILATITKPSQGDVLFNGQDIVRNPQAIRSVLGYLPQYFGVYEQLTGSEFLEYMASIKGIDSKEAAATIKRLLSDLNLAHVANTPLSGYSGGMRQRIGIAQALLNDPKILIVDEPTVGLDPHERNNFRQLLTELANDRCIIFSTHIVSDIETIADRIAIMCAGKLLQVDTPKALIDKVTNKCWSLTTEAQKVKALSHQFIVSHSVRDGDLMKLHIVSDHSPCESAQPREATLEDAYLYFTSHASNTSDTGDNQGQVE